MQLFDVNAKYFDANYTKILIIFHNRFEGINVCVLYETLRNVFKYYVIILTKDDLKDDGKISIF